MFKCAVLYEVWTKSSTESQSHISIKTACKTAFGAK